jgi:hypothetical protein
MATSAPAPVALATALAGRGLRLWKLHDPVDVPRDQLEGLCARSCATTAQKQELCDWCLLNLMLNYFTYDSENCCSLEVWFSLPHWKHPDVYLPAYDSYVPLWSINRRAPCL